MDAARNRLDPDRPLTLVLGGGGVRGLAHIGALDAVVASGFRVAEIVGTSAGALVGAFYAGAGMDVATLRDLGLGITTRQLLAWAWLRRVPTPVRRRLGYRAGAIPAAMELLAAASWERMHHGVERVGLVAYDLVRREVVVGHNAQRLVSIEDAARGAAALPVLFGPRRCRAGSRELRLTDGGVADCLPLAIALEPPFRAEQVLAVDISNTRRARERALDKVFAARAARPDVPIALALPSTLGRPTVLFRASRVSALYDAGRRAAYVALGAECGQSAAEAPRAGAGSASLAGSGT
jgi:NTE family protein